MILSKDKIVLVATLKEVEEWLAAYEKNRSEAATLTPESPSLLLRELIQTVKEGREPNSMPLYRSLTHIHSFVGLFQNMITNLQPEVRTLCVTVWGITGLPVVQKLADLYRFLIWESTILIDLIETKTMQNVLGKDDFEQKLIVKEEYLGKEAPKKEADQSSLNSPTTENLECEVQLMEIGSPENSNRTIPITVGIEKQMEMKQKMIKMVPHEIATQLGAKLSTLFALFVKMAVGGSVRPRQHGFNAARNPQMTTPLEPAREIAKTMTKHVAATLRWKPPLDAPNTKFRFSFLTCAVQLGAQLLMDDSRAPYHLMLQHLLAANGDEVRVEDDIIRS